MPDAVDDFLLGLREPDWLRNVGVPCDYAEVQPSWDAALMLIKSSSQREFTLEMANQIRDRIQVRARPKYALWNEIVRRHRQTIQELADLKLSPDAAGRRLPKCVQDIVYWYLSNATIELTYGELVHPHYFVPTSQWLHKGHLPITWEGNFPQGKPVIF